MKIKNIRKKPKVWLYPSAVEREYVKALEAITDNVINEVDKFCKKQQENYRLLIRQDGLNEWLDAIFAELLSAMQFFVGDSEIQRLVSGLLGEANRFNKKQFHQTLKKAYGVDIFTSEQWLLEQLKLFELQNINLIKSIPTQLHEKLRYKFVDAVQKGRRWEEVAKEIEELTGATRKRARLIARDQIGKLNGQLTQLRQKQIGVKSYIWRTSLDERVRKLHVSREGEQFDWDNPPNDGHPGEAINCRCYAEAVLPDLDELINQGNAVAVMNNAESITKSAIIPATTDKKRNNMRSEWEDDFPDTIIDRKLGEATGHPDYASAKSGDVIAAYKLANDLVTDEAIKKLKAIVKSTDDVVIVPVHAEEAVGINMIPLAVSRVISEKLNIPIDLSIVQATKVSRTGGNGWHRLANSPAFDGDFKKGKKAIILDDTQTQGGTLASLKGHIENLGGKVVGAYALTGKQYSVQLRLSKETLKELRGKYGVIEQWWNKTFGYDFSKLTEWEAKFILNSGKTPDEVRDLVSTAKYG